MRRLHCSYDELGEMPEWLIVRAKLWFNVVDKVRADAADAAHSKR